jgi:DNA-binding SARP family transcriptional activator
MAQLHVSLFGKFCARNGERMLEELNASKVQELFCYLLLNNGRPHHRETLANLLWQEQSAAQSKGYLRRTLWQLQNAIPDQPALNSLLRVEDDWIQIDCTPGLWSDVVTFEQAFAGVKGKPGEMLEETAVSTLTEAIQLYQGDLLEGWYQDWCLLERERLQQMLLMMLDKLMAYCESSGDYETGILYGAQILRHDSARECTHRRLMRLHYLSGDRTGALRQYQRCKAILQQELVVQPAAATERLNAQIQTDHLRIPAQTSDTSTLQETLQRLQTLDAILNQTHHQIQHEIHRLQFALL